MDKLLRLQPVTPEKHELLEQYVSGFRTVYYQAARAGLYADSEKFNRKNAHDWHRAHYYLCEHKPRCYLIMSYLNIKRREYLTWAKQQSADSRTIHFTAFNHAWWKGFINRTSSPFAYHKMALVPKQLVSVLPDFAVNGSTRAGEDEAVQEELLSFRLQPRTELLFRLTPVESQWTTALLKSHRAVTLLDRASGWFLRA